MSDLKPNFPSSLRTGAGGKASLQHPAARRTPAVAIDMPVEVVGKTLHGELFRREARTTDVNAHGAHLILVTTTEIEPAILLINKKTGTEAQCHLLYQKKMMGGKYELGIEFVAPQPRFWGIAFPPEDWSRAERKIPAFTNR